MAPLIIATRGTFGTHLKMCVPFVPFSGHGQPGQLSGLSRLSRLGGGGERQSCGPIRGEHVA